MRFLQYIAPKPKIRYSQLSIEVRKRVTLYVEA